MAREKCGYCGEPRNAMSLISIKGVGVICLSCHRKGVGGEETMSTTNDAGQKVVGGLPQTNLAISDIITYYGSIVGCNTEGDLLTWRQGDNRMESFHMVAQGVYNYDGYTDEDLEGRDLEYVVELAEELFG